MRSFPAILFQVLLSACGTTKYVEKGTVDGIEIAYRWSHPMGKPSELLLRLKNTTLEDRNLNLAIDLYYQGRTLETMLADTCIRAGHTLNGKLNGIYFTPGRVTTEQIKDGGTQVETTRTMVEPTLCP